MDGIYEGKVVEIKCPYVLSEEHPENDNHIHPNDFDKRELLNKFCKKVNMSINIKFLVKVQMHNYGN